MRSTHSLEWKIGEGRREKLTEFSWKSSCHQRWLNAVIFSVVFQQNNSERKLSSVIKLF